MQQEPRFVTRQPLDKTKDVSSDNAAVRGTISKRTLVLLVFFGLIVLLLQLRPNGDVDVFWRVKIGQLALDQGGLVRTDPFTSTHAGEPTPPLSWLAEVFYAALYRLGSWRLLSQANALVIAAGLLIAALTVRRRETSIAANLLGLALGLLVVLPHCQIRTQSFAVLWFPLLMLVAQSRIRPGRKLVLAAAVLVIWQNMHPSVMVAAVALTALAAARWARWLFDRRTDVPWIPALLVVLAVLCAMATPMGWAVFETSAQNSKLSRELGISEWMSIWDPAVRAPAMSVWVALLISAVLLARLRRRVRLEDLALFLVLAAVSLPVYRLSLFLGVAMIPIWSRWIAAVLSADRPGRAPEAASEVTVPALRAAGVASVVLTAALGLPPLLGTRIHSREMPLAAVERLGELGVRGVIYNYREWGGPLIWAGYPDWKVTIDGRLYLFTPEDWDRYRRIALGEVPAAEVDRWYHPDAFLLRPDYHRRFIRLLRDSGDWEEAYADDSAVVFLRHN